MYWRWWPSYSANTSAYKKPQRYFTPRFLPVHMMHSVKRTEWWQRAHSCIPDKTTLLYLMSPLSFSAAASWGFTFLATIARRFKNSKTISASTAGGRNNHSTAASRGCCEGSVLFLCGTVLQWSGRRIGRSGYRCITIISDSAPTECEKLLIHYRSCLI